MVASSACDVEARWSAEAERLRARFDGFGSEKPILTTDKSDIQDTFKPPRFFIHCKLILTDNDNDDNKLVQ